MATTNANESRAKDNYFDRKGKTDYRNQNYNKAAENSYKPRDNFYKTNDSNNKTKDNFIPRDNTYRTRENNIRTNNGFPRNNDNRSKTNTFGTKENGFIPRENYTKQAGSFGGRERSGYAEHRNSFSYQPSMDKDDDSDSKNTRGRKPAESKAKNSIGKDLEQPDKLETIKRLEREKKVIQKKSREEETEKPKRPIVKQKRSTKDWTKDYECGLLDEENAF